MYQRFFGYGSLVNAATHDFAGLRPARLDGWRRRWVVTPARALSYLSAEPRAGVSIDGAVAEVPDGGWAALDERERAYARIDVSGSVTPPMAGTCVYSVQDGGAPGQGGILASYLGAVVQGFAKLHGEDAVWRFFDTTEGWEAPVVWDLDAPRYPRAVTLHAQDVEMMREGLERFADA